MDRYMKLSLKDVKQTEREIEVSEVKRAYEDAIMV